jgi:branched-chain amino acid transport system permease protein
MGAHSFSIRKGKVGLSWVKWVAILGILCFMPLAFKVTTFSDYLSYLAVRIMILGLYAMSYDLLFGYTGIFSFGHATFLGCGAYSAAVLMVKTGLGIEDATLGILGALAVGVLMGWFVGFLCSKVGQVAVFLVTFAFTESIQLLILSDPLKFTNAEDGITGIPRSTVLGFLGIGPEINFYYFVLIILIISYLVLKYITLSPMGDTFTAIRDNPLRVRFLGYRISHYRIAAFMISGLFAALAGALTALHERAVAPEMFSWFISGDAVLYNVLGGHGTLVGPILGAGIVIIFQEILSDLFNNWLIFLGLSYIVLIMFLPKGIFPLLRALRLGRSHDQSSEEYVQLQ